MGGNYLKGVLMLTGLLACMAGALSASEGYLIGRDDVLLIRSAQIHEIDEKRVTVSKDGRVDLPMIGQLEVGGKSASDVAAELGTRFNQFYYNPSAAVEILEYHSQPVSVLGEVQNPGIYQLAGQKTLAELLSMAGGLRPDAGYLVHLSRQEANGSEHVLSYKLADLLRGGDSQKVLLQRGDTLTVPKAQLIYVLGDVRKPGGFVLGPEGKTSVLEALALSEGALPTAALSRCTLLRPSTGGPGHTAIPMNVKEMEKAKSGDVMLTAGDVLVVPSSTARKVGVKAAEAALQTASGLAIWGRL